MNSFTKTLVIFIGAVSATLCLQGQIPDQLRVKGLVSKKQTATLIAQAVLEDVYGKSNIARQLPLRVKETKIAWECEGQLATGRVGGVARIRIAKQDGRVLEITHGK